MALTRKKREKTGVFGFTSKSTLNIPGHGCLGSSVGSPFEPLLTGVHACARALHRQVRAPLSHPRNNAATTCRCKTCNRAFPDDCQSHRHSSSMELDCLAEELGVEAPTKRSTFRHLAAPPNRSAQPPLRPAPLCPPATQMSGQEPHLHAHAPLSKFQGQSPPPMMSERAGRHSDIPEGDQRELSATKFTTENLLGTWQMLH